mmetsp:Transcript_5816/g.18939  ORF Transcript_5816/g.18939 Transcript_5816/m.18939 type:complete len:273 (-) Transcript_5816:130-948(-)
MVFRRGSADRSARSSIEGKSLFERSRSTMPRHSSRPRRDVRRLSAKLRVWAEPMAIQGVKVSERRSFSATSRTLRFSRPLTASQSWRADVRRFRLRLRTSKFGAQAVSGARSRPQPWSFRVVTRKRGTFSRTASHDSATGVALMDRADDEYSSSLSCVSSTSSDVDGSMATTASRSASRSFFEQFSKRRKSKFDKNSEQASATSGGPFACVPRTRNFWIVRSSSRTLSEENSSSRPTFRSSRNGREHHSPLDLRSDVTSCRNARSSGGASGV